MAGKKKVATDTEVVAETKEVKTMTVYEALSERKILKDRIGKLVRGDLECTFIYNPKTKSVHGGGRFEKTDLENLSISRVDKIDGLIKRYSLLSELIDHSNAITPITIAGKIYSSKSAAMAAYGVIESEINVYEVIKAKIALNVRTISDNDMRQLSEDRIADYISKLNLSPETSSETIAELRKNYIEQNSLELIDPKNMRTKVDEIIQELNEFKERFNTEINKSNLQTFIEVPVD